MTRARHEIDADIAEAEATLAELRAERQTAPWTPEQRPGVFFFDGGNDLWITRGNDGGTATMVAYTAGNPVGEILRDYGPLRPLTPAEQRAHGLITDAEKAFIAAAFDEWVDQDSPGDTLFGIAAQAYWSEQP